MTTGPSFRDNERIMLVDWYQKENARLHDEVVKWRNMANARMAFVHGMRDVKKVLAIQEKISYKIVFLNIVDIVNKFTFTDQPARKT